MTRRTWMAATAAAAAAQSAAPSTLAELIRANDKAVDLYLTRQVTDQSSRYRGGIPDADGLFIHGSAATLITIFSISLLRRDSRYFGSAEVMDRLRLAVDYVKRGLSKDGNISLAITNFNSPPDTAFFVNPVATTAVLARRAKATAVSETVEPLLWELGRGLKAGGVHTPNHRWVVTSALAQLFELTGDEGYRKRAEQWLAEGIDQDADGQFSERSTTVYNTVSDKGLTIAAIKLNRPELLDYVRRNLDAMAYLLHPGDEVVTEISKRQDKNVRALPNRYWFPAKYLAVRDNNGLYESFARAGVGGQDLPLMLEYPELEKEVAPAPLPTNYEKVFPTVGLARVRRGDTSATMQFTGSDRVFCLRRGEVVMNGVRFASAFFGKGQFIPRSGGPKAGGGYEFSQKLSGPYYQPLEAKPEPAIVYHEQWGESWKRRKQSEVCALEQSAVVTEEKNGFAVRLRAHGTDEVPVTVEISFAAGGVLEGCEKMREERYLLTGGGGSYRVGKDVMRFGPGIAGQHRYVEVRGALPKLDGTSVYITGYTPFDHTIRFEW